MKTACADRLLAVLATVWLLGLLSVLSPALAERRVALVVGNSAYQHVPALANPTNDASDMAAKLKNMGFEVVSGTDLDLDELRRTVRDFAGRLEGADMAVFFYAGHGLQVNGENYLVPVNAKLAAAIDLDFETVPVNLVMSAMEQSAKVNLVFLDACRDNPLADNLARSMGTRSGAVGRGLAKIGSGVGSLIAYATQPGNVALDGTGRNSPFTTALLKHLGTPGMDISRELVLVRRSVLDQTGGKQVPWDNSSLTGEVVLVAAPAQLPEEPETAPSAKSGSSDGVNPIEMEYWDSVKNRSSAEYFERYIARFPNGAFVDIARLRAQELKASVQPEPQPQAGKDDAGQEAVASLELQESGSSGTVDPPMNDADLTRGMQIELARVGCLAGKPDGKWGRSSERALKDFAARQGMKLASLEPDPRILERLKETADRICPLVCGKGQEERNGRCIAVKKEPPADKKSNDAKKPGDTKTTAQGNCPSNATFAANQVYPPSPGTFARTGGGATFYGTHPCGRRFKCIRGTGGARCTWQ